MIRRMVDTSAYSAFKRGHPGVVQAIRESAEIYLNPVVLGELRSGFLKGNRAEKNLAELSTFLGSPRVSVFSIDSETAERYAVTFAIPSTCRKSDFHQRHMDRGQRHATRSASVDDGSAFSPRVPGCR